MSTQLSKQLIYTSNIFSLLNFPTAFSVIQFPRLLNYIWNDICF